MELILGVAMIVVILAATSIVVSLIEKNRLLRGLYAAARHENKWHREQRRKKPIRLWRVFSEPASFDLGHSGFEFHEPGCFHFLHAQVTFRIVNTRQHYCADLGNRLDISARFGGRRTYRSGIVWHHRGDNALG